MTVPAEKTLRRFPALIAIGISAALTVHYAGHAVVTLIRVNIQTDRRILAENSEESS